jgi:hypothetical protein
MKVLLAALVVLLMVCAGCAGKKRAGSGPTKATGAAPAGQTNSVATPKPVVTPDTGLAGKVVSYNDVGRFAVMNFPSGRLPAVEQRLFVYRQGLKVGEVKVDTWQLGENAVADLVSGEAKPGDEVRDK